MHNFNLLVGGTEYARVKSGITKSINRMENIRIDVIIGASSLSGLLVVAIPCLAPSRGVVWSIKIDLTPVVHDRFPHHIVHLHFLF